MGKLIVLLGAAAGAVWVLLRRTEPQPDAWADTTDPV